MPMVRLAMLSPRMIARWARGVVCARFVCPYNQFMRISVVGTGYVGLVVSSCLAENGNNVVGVDIDQAKIRRLSNGESPIYEPGLEGLLKGNLEEGGISFSTDLGGAVKGSEIIFV